MEQNYFNELIVNDFYGLKLKFQTKLKSIGLEFDEDLFVDTLLKCNNTLNNKDLPKNDLLKYWWVAYCNELKRPKTYSQVDINENIDYYDRCDKTYDEEIDEIYELVINELYKKFDKHIIDAWVNHTCYNKSYKGLEEMGYKFKFNNEFKKINRYIKTKLITSNVEITELLYSFQYKES